MSDYVTLLDDLRRRIDALSKRSEFVLRKFEVGRAADASVLKSLLQVGDVRLPDSLIERYSAFNGITLSWAWNEGALEYSGGIRLPSIEVLMGGFGSTGVVFKKDAFSERFFDGVNRTSPKWAKGLRLWDEDGEHGYSVGIIPKRSVAFFVCEQYALYKMRLTVNEYVALAFQVLGIAFWQHHLIAADDLPEIKSYRSFAEVHLKMFGSEPGGVFRK